MRAHSHNLDCTGAMLGRAAFPILIVAFAALFASGAASRPLALLYNRIAYAWQPRVHVPEPHHDWGTAHAGQIVEHRFRIENRGGRPLYFPRDIFA